MKLNYLSKEELEHSTLNRYEAITNSGDKYTLLKDIETNRIYLDSADSPETREQCLSAIGSNRVDETMLEDDKLIEFLFIYDSYVHNWVNIYFSTQVIYLKREKGKFYIGIQFILNDLEAHCWYYKYAPLFVFSKFDEIDIPDLLIYRSDDPGVHKAISVENEVSNDQIPNDVLNSIIRQLPDIELKLYNEIEGFKWKSSYDTDEPQFTREVLIPLLNKMGYENVRYNHGRDEYGRDIIFSTINRFGKEINFGVQAKAGDVSGGATGLIDTLIGQLDDAFSMPFKRLGDPNDKFIAVHIVAISGKYTNNAKQKLLSKIDKWNKENVCFWDKEKILELIDKYW